MYKLKQILKTWKITTFCGVCVCVCVCVYVKSPLIMTKCIYLKYHIRTI